MSEPRSATVTATRPDVSFGRQTLLRIGRGGLLPQPGDAELRRENRRLGRIRLREGIAEPGVDGAERRLVARIAFAGLLDRGPDLRALSELGGLLLILRDDREAADILVTALAIPGD